MSDTEANMAVGGLIVAPIFFIAVGFAVAYIVEQKRQSDEKVKWPIMAGFVLAAISLIGQIAPKSTSAAPMGEIERKKRAAGDVVENISFDRNIDPNVELPSLPFDENALAAIGNETGSILSAEFPKRGISIAGPLSAEASNLILQGKKLYQIEVKGELANGEGPIFMLMISGPLKKGAGTLSCTSIDGQSFEFSNSPCRDEAFKFFELSGTKL